jgi:hypothetical protein
MSNENVIKTFLSGGQAKTPLRTIQNGYYSYKGRTLYTEENNLINYRTTIATLKDNKLYLNINKYSNTTSHIQSKIRRIASSKGLEIIEVKGIDEYINR